MNEPIISVSGLRGIVGDSLTPLVAIQYVAAFASLIDDPGPIIVARDGRATGQMLAKAVCASLVAVGRTVKYANVAATPTIGVLIRHCSAAGGVQISASHNPVEYNGIKLFGQDGRVISAEHGQRVKEAYRAARADWKSHDRVGSVENIDDSISKHLALILATVDVETIAAQRFRVLLDSNHGAGSILGRALLDRLNCDFEILGDAPDGRFEHPPEPLEENLETIVNCAIELRADAAFCQDPDADRLAVIDERGRFIGEEYTLALTLEHLLSRRQGPVVVNCSSSRMSADIAARYGCELHCTAVGEANVTAKMIAVQAIYGGEGNGGPIDPRVGYVRDSFVGMAQILDAMAANRKTIGELVSQIPHYQIHKSKFSVQPMRVPLLMRHLIDSFPDAAVDRTDGLKFIWSDRWLLVRSSNTEPVVRAIAEATTMDRARALCDQVLALAKSEL
jgi:phosphomannomutase